MWGIEGETPQEGEWPKRDAVPRAPIGLKPVEVTEEMREIGGAALREECLKRFGTTWANDVAWDFAEVAFRAMHDAARVPLMSDAEIALTEERDHWKSEAHRLANGPPTQHSPEFVAKVLMDREGRYNDPTAHARLTEVIKCARLDGRKQARDDYAALRLEPVYDGGPDHLAALAKERDAMRSTLELLGYTYHGGTHWKPPLGRAAPFLLVDADGETVRRLAKERDEARTELAKMTRDRNRSVEERNRFGKYANSLFRDVAAKDARIAELDSRLAVFMADPDASKKPAPDPKPLPAQALAPPKGDPRMIGR